MSYFVKKAPDLRGAGLGDYFVGFTGSGMGLTAHWGPKHHAKPMDYAEAIRTAGVWSKGDIVEIVREQ